MVKTRAFETRSALCAVMEAEPGCAIRLAGTVAVITLEFDTVVASAKLFQKTTVPAANPEPLTVRTNDGPPGTAVAGERLVNEKFGMIVKVSGAGDV
jgi:hypothetical protein